MLSSNGRVSRHADRTVVEVPWALGEYALGEPGVEVMNPDAPPDERIVRKTFTRKRVYLPDELPQAVAAHLAHDDNLIVSMNGYSQINQTGAVPTVRHP